MPASERDAAGLAMDDQKKDRMWAIDHGRYPVSPDRARRRMNENAHCPDRPTVTKGRRARTWGVGTACLALLLYVMSAFIVFDMSEAAHKWDVDNDSLGNPVALGPSPRHCFCAPTMYDTCYKGDEWPFRLYTPVCRLWLRVHGYVPPAPPWPER